MRFTIIASTCLLWSFVVALPTLDNGESNNLTKRAGRPISSDEYNWLLGIVNAYGRDSEDARRSRQTLVDRGVNPNLPELVRASTYGGLQVASPQNQPAQPGSSTGGGGQRGGVDSYYRVPPAYASPTGAELPTARSPVLAAGGTMAPIAEMGQRSPAELSGGRVNPNQAPGPVPINRQSTIPAPTRTSTSSSSASSGNEGVFGNEADYTSPMAGKQKKEKKKSRFGGFSNPFSSKSNKKPPPSGGNSGVSA